MNEGTKILDQTERVTVYDWLRLIATVFVVIGHSSYLSIQTLYGGVAYELPEMVNDAYNSLFLSWCRWMSGWVYGFHMPLFFMLSGAVLALKPIGTFDKVFKSKVRRLLIPYFVYGWLFMFPMKRLGNFYDNATLKSALKGFLSGQDSGHLWFLTALFWCVIIFIGIHKAFVKKNINSFYAVLVVCGAIQLLCSYIPIDILGLKTGLSYIFYFSLGFVFEVERRNNQRWSIQKTILMCLLLFFIELINKKYDLLDSFFTIIIGSFFTYIIADLCDRFFYDKITKNRVWNLIIKNLFYVYLLHDPLEYVVLRIFISEGFLESSIGCYAYVFCRIVVIFFVTLIAGEIISIIKTKMGSWLNGNCTLRKDN